MNLTKQKEENQALEVAILIAKLFLVIFVVIQLFHGIHKTEVGLKNLDAGQNLRWINTKYNHSILDRVDNETVWTADEQYMNGFNQVSDGIAETLWFSFIFGMLVMYYIGKG